VNNNRNKIKARFNIIDLIIIIVILGCIAGAAIRYNVADRIGINAEQKTVEISFVIKDVRNSTAEALVIGDNFYWEQNGALLGVLKDKQSSEAESHYVGDDGVLQSVYSSERCDIKGVLTSTGTINEDGSFMLAGNQFVSAGKELDVKSPHIEVTLIITDIQQVQ